MRSARPLLGAGLSLPTLLISADCQALSRGSVFARVLKSAPCLRPQNRGFGVSQTRFYAAYPGRTTPLGSTPYLKGTTYPGRKTPAEKADEKTMPVDEEIIYNYDFVYLRQADGKLSQPRSTTKLGKTLDFKTQILQCLALPAGPGRPAGPGVPEHPICKIIENRAEFFAAERAKVKAEKKKKALSKEVEINWAIGPGDLERKFAQLSGFLDKGCKVDIRLVKRTLRNKRLADNNEAKEVLRRVKDFIFSHEGTTECAEPDGTVGENMTIYLQGTMKGSAGKSATKGAAKSVAKNAE